MPTGLWKRIESGGPLGRGTACAFKLQFGQENLATAHEEITGDDAVVNISRGGGVVQFIRFQKVGGCGESMRRRWMTL